MLQIWAPFTCSSTVWLWKEVSISIWIAKQWWSDSGASISAKEDPLGIVTKSDNLCTPVGGIFSYIKSGNCIIVVIVIVGLDRDVGALGWSGMYDLWTFEVVDRCCPAHSSQLFPKKWSNGVCDARNKEREPWHLNRTDRLWCPQPQPPSPPLCNLIDPL